MRDKLNEEPKYTDKILAVWNDARRFFTYLSIPKISLIIERNFSLIFGKFNKLNNCFESLIFF